MELYNDDCFQVFPKIEDKSIDLFVLDLPYANKKFGNCSVCDWDNAIDLEKMWVEIKRMMSPSAVIVFFCNTKFGYALINSNPKWFRYDLIWKKSKHVGFLNANKMPLRQHENIYIFNSNKNDDVDLVKNIELREYSKKIYKYIGKSKKVLLNEIGQGIDHFFRFSSSQFALPIEENYNKLIEKYNIDKMEGFKTYDEMKNLVKLSTYNPQKTEGKPYKSKEKKYGESVYKKDSYKKTAIKNEGDRHPSSILEYKNPHKTIHPTQKPVDLLEWLIKTYSNEGDTIMDFTMGSGTTGEACRNTNRKFIGIEKDEEIFKKAQNRLEI